MKAIFRFHCHATMAQMLLINKNYPKSTGFPVYRDIDNLIEKYYPLMVKHLFHINGKNRFISLLLSTASYSNTSSLSQTPNPNQIGVFVLIHYIII